MKDFKTMIIAPPGHEQFELIAHEIAYLAKPDCYSFPDWDIRVVEEQETGTFWILRYFWEFDDYNKPPRLHRMAIEHYETLFQLCRATRRHPIVMDALHEQGYIRRRKLSEALNRGPHLS